MRIIFLILIYCPSIFCYSQEHTPRCHFDSVYAQELKSVTYQDFLIREEHAFQEYLNNKNQYRHTQYTIPVVVHIVKNDIHSDMNITDEDIYRQIEILNETYNQLNDDLNQTPEEFQEFIGNPQIEFCLATVDPNGYATSGITRNSTEITLGLYLLAHSVCLVVYWFQLNKNWECLCSNKRDNLLLTNR